MPLADETRVIRTLLPMACDGVGPSFTCLQLMNAAHRAGYRTEVFANRLRVQRPEVPMQLALPGPLALLPYQSVVTPASRWLERRFLDSIGPNDIAYLWPSVSLETHRVLHDRGIPIVLEGINTRMKSAKRILDAAYEAFGAPPAHGITDARIADEEEKYTYASAIFAPNRNVEAALKGSPLENRFISTSYGVDTTKASPDRHYADHGRPLVFMFCGYACVRKGVHHLLDAWKQMPGKHKLQLVGNIEPLIADRYRDLLASDRVEVVGFVKNVHPYFAKADVFVFPSLEEGGPQVTYEAALHGLPIIASSMGASRLGDTDGTMMVVKTSSVEELMEAMERIVVSSEFRRDLGRATRKCAFDFDWLTVGAKRAALLQGMNLVSSTNS
jgi:glycosyltransferase involved in cell wall biosynthesis